MKIALLVTLLAWVAAPAGAAEQLYRNGRVHTQDAAGTQAEALLVRDGKVVAAGTAAELLRTAPRAQIHDLKGATIVPGFYAAHDHFPATGLLALTQVDLNSPPMGRIETIEQLVSALRERAATTPEGQWLLGRGYDDTLLAEKRHPTRADLDRASARHPIWIVHSSGHFGAANSRALTMAKVTARTPQPEGGRIRIDPATGEPNGVFEERLSYITRLIPSLTPEQHLEAIALAEKQYLAKGVTTTVIAGIGAERARDLDTARASGKLHLQTITLRTDPEAVQPPRGGVKLWHDGSIQGYTGYLSEPYHQPSPDQPGYRGYPTGSRAQLIGIVLRLHRAGFQIAIHGNGDAAIDDILEAFEQAQRSWPLPGTRHRIEHCQSVRLDQLQRIRRLGLTPSFLWRTSTIGATAAATCFSAPSAPPASAPWPPRSRKACASRCTTIRR